MTIEWRTASRDSRIDFHELQDFIFSSIHPSPNISKNWSKKWNSLQSEPLFVNRPAECGTFGLSAWVSYNFVKLPTSCAFKKATPIRTMLTKLMMRCGFSLAMVVSERASVSSKWTKMNEYNDWATTGSDRTIFLNWFCSLFVVSFSNWNCSLT